MYRERERTAQFKQFLRLFASEMLGTRWVKYPFSRCRFAKTENPEPNNHVGTSLCPGGNPRCESNPLESALLTNQDSRKFCKCYSVTKQTETCL